MSDNTQQSPISGYRTLTPGEIRLINDAKTLEAEVLRLVCRVNSRIDAQQTLSTPEEERRVTAAQASRWAAIARTDIEQGFMALVRAIAQPQPHEE